MGSCMCFLRNPPPCVAVLPIPLLIFSGNYWGFGFISFFLTSSALILSTTLITSSKNKPQMVEQESSSPMESCSVSSEATTQNREEAQERGSSFDHQSSTSEDSEAEDNVDHSPDWSDGYISDEDSLFEIALTSGHYVGHKKELELKSMDPQPRKLPDFLQLQHTLKELLAEINEEDNMIEIDISMGSIKCSRFQIEA